jgi:hypothetical protein
MLKYLDEYLIMKIYKYLHKIDYKTCLNELKDKYPKINYKSGGLMFEIAV